MRRALAPMGEALAPMRRALAPTREALAPMRRALAPMREALAPMGKALAPTRGPLAPTRGPLAPYVMRWYNTLAPTGVEYTQGQSPQHRIREYFYYIDHQGMLFLDDARIKNFTSCFKEGRAKLRHVLRSSCVSASLLGPVESEDDAHLIPRLYPSPPSLSRDENEVEFEEDWSRSRRPILHAGDVDGEDQEEIEKHMTPPYTNIKGCKVSQLSLKPSLGATVQIVPVKPSDVINDGLFEVTEAGLDGERGSVTDASLGPLSIEGRSVVCPTCWNSHCLGHWAYIDLGDYFLYPGKIRSCLNILKSICFYCRGPAFRCSEEGNFLAKPNHCSQKQPKYMLKKIGGVSMILVKSTGEKYTLHPVHIRKYFKHTPASTWKELRISNPADEFFVSNNNKDEAGEQQQLEKDDNEKGKEEKEEKDEIPKPQVNLKKILMDQYHPKNKAYLAVSRALASLLNQQ
ncbi:hypothetical protein Pcinc_038309 [Petrolisthes cinctipes]|uniref:Uncharacterized protein n=1 Tax=Petrolisthes cinctipes TaxID=88211 RepID=A0AAE1BRU2_PETCI|nr:hypothetical protein Pcinc_038309 [Petrolisthes cinctipes]